MEGAQGCQVRWLVTEQDGAPTFAMRQFEVAPGGCTPRHHHAYEHEVYVLEGQGVVYEGDRPQPLTAGDVVLVKPDEVHQFRNTGEGPLRFLCLIPNSATGQQVTVVPECGDEGRQ
jgi:quercetin dioxygenase-like cupin family protein